MRAVRTQLKMEQILNRRLRIFVSHSCDLLVSNLQIKKGLFSSIIINATEHKLSNLNLNLKLFKCSNIQTEIEIKSTKRKPNKPRAQNK